jgi:MFS family permease
MPRFSFFPMYMLASLKTIGMGIMSAAVSSMLILELGQPAWVAGVVGAVNNLGFVLFIVFFGNLADRMPRYKALRLLLTLSVITAAVRLLPLTTPTNITIFSIFHFLEGGACGLFWCVVQSYALVAHRLGEKERDNFLSGYNFSWNIGIIGGFLLGTIFVPLASTNYISFWINFINAAISGVLAFTSVKDERDTEPLPLKAMSPIAPTQRVDLDTKVNQALRLYAPYVVLLILLVHPFADGSLTVLGPLKIKFLLMDSTAVYSLFLVKYITQTIACP